MNNITVSATICSIAASKRVLYVKIHRKSKTMLQVLLPEELDSSNFISGQRVVIAGRLASKDIYYPNPCDCETFSEAIETYLLADTVHVREDQWINTVEVSGTLTQEPKLIQTPTVSFLSARIQLDDGNGFLTVTKTVTESGKESFPAQGTSFTIKGTLHTKDYNKKLYCPLCQHTSVFPMMNAWVVADN